MERRAFLTVAAASLLLVGCSGNPETLQPSEKGDGSDESTLQPEAVAPSVSDGAADLQEEIQFYNFYEITDSAPMFSMVMTQNKIDEDYDREWSSGIATAHGLRVLQVKYIDIWKAELQYSIDNFTEVLSLEDKAMFLALQQRWESDNADNFEFERRILTDQQYDTVQPTSFIWLFTMQIRESYRERAIRVKYLHYLLEKAKISAEWNNPDSYISLKFKYHEDVDGT